MTVPYAPMTVEEFLALPDEDMDRELIRGTLREKQKTYHSRHHAKTEANLIGLLGRWLELQGPVRGELHSGDVGCILRRNPDTMVGVDVAYFSAAQLARQPRQSPWLEVPPTLAIKIREATDADEALHEKVGEYLLAGVPLVWLVDPAHQTITHFSPGVEPRLFNVTEELSADPHLPGFRATAVFE